MPTCQMDNSTSSIKDFGKALLVTSIRVFYLQCAGRQANLRVFSGDIVMSGQ
jgi:hypothetical protein